MILINKRAKKQDYQMILAIWEKSVIATHDFLAAEDRQFYKKKIPGFLDQVELLLWFSGEEIVGFSGTSGQELDMLFIVQKQPSRSNQDKHRPLKNTLEPLIQLH